MLARTLWLQFGGALFAGGLVGIFCSLDAIFPTSDNLTVSPTLLVVIGMGALIGGQIAQGVDARRGASALKEQCEFRRAEAGKHEAI